MPTGRCEVVLGGEMNLERVRRLKMLNEFGLIHIFLSSSSFNYQ